MATLNLESPFEPIPPGPVWEIVQGDQKIIGLALSDLDLVASPGAILSYVARAGHYLANIGISGPDRDRVALTGWQHPTPPIEQRTLAANPTAEGVAVVIPADLWTAPIEIAPAHQVPIVVVWVEVRDSSTTPETISNRAVRLIVRRGPLSGA